MDRHEDGHSSAAASVHAVLASVFVTGHLAARVAVAAAVAAAAAATPGAMTAQLNYYRQALSGGSKDGRTIARDKRLGGRNGRKLALPVL